MDSLDDNLPFLDLPIPDANDEETWKWNKDDDSFGHPLHSDLDHNDPHDDDEIHEGASHLYLTDEDSVAVVSPGSSKRRRRISNDKIHDDQFVDSIVVSPLASQTLNESERHEDTLRNLDHGKIHDFNEGVSNSLIGESPESIHLQYQRLMKRLADSMQRTEETRQFIKRRRCDIGGSFFLSSDSEESRKYLFEVFRRDSGSGCSFSP